MFGFFQYQHIKQTQQIENAIKQKNLVCNLVLLITYAITNYSKAKDYDHKKPAMNDLLTKMGRIV